MHLLLIYALIYATNNTIYHIVGTAWGVGGSAMNKTSFLFLYNMHLEGGDSSKQVVSNKEMKYS